MVDHCDGWLPIETLIDDWPTALADLNDRAEKAGRAPGSIPISFFCIDTPDEQRLERYRDMGAVRTAVRIPTEGRDVILPFLDSYAAIAQRLE